MNKPAWLEEIQKSPASIPRGASHPPPPLFDATHQPITTREEWLRRRQMLRAAWNSFLGSIPGDRRAPVLTVLEEDRPQGVRRSLVRYEAEKGWPVEGYLLRPEERTGLMPGVVVFHSTTLETIRQPAGLAGTKDLHIGLELARRGYVVFCPRCFLWQYRAANDFEVSLRWMRQQHPGVTGMAKMLFDAVRALDVLAAQPGVDPRRLGAIGHSLGAKEVLYLAAFDDRVRATVFSEGGIGLSYSNWDAPWYLGDSIRRPGFPLDHGELLCQIAPRAFLLLGGDSADGDTSWPYVEAAMPVWKLMGAPEAVGLLNHKKGHAFPEIAQVRSREWLDWFLRPA